MISLTDYLPHLKVKQSVDTGPEIWCAIRKVWLKMTPEEMVRQAAILHLIDLKYSIRHITVERQLLFLGKRKRYDIAVSDKKGHIKILVECKRPEQKLNQNALDQAGVYNHKLLADYLWITNGYNSLIYHINHSNKITTPKKVLPTLE
jgi:hypothetical protein